MALRIQPREEEEYGERINDRILLPTLWRSHKSRVEDTC